MRHASPARAVALSACMVLSCTPPTPADDWTNSGGNAGRNGLTTEIGPDAATVSELLWSVGRPSIIAWQPVIAGSRVFLVRQTSFPPETTGSPVVAMNLDTGAELWFQNIPAQPSDRTAWIAGVSNGNVYASRSGYNQQNPAEAAPLYALDQADGHIVWPSVDEIDAAAYDGVVFAPNGDPVVASFRTIKRIRATDGTTAWTANRVGSVSGNCGGAIHGNAIYVADAVPGGNAIKKFDLDTGAFLYQSPVLAGFTIQNTPMASPDGTIYLARVQNNAAVDFFFAINDDGAAMTVRWSTPAAYSYSSEFAVGNDNSVYMLAPGNVIKRLDPAAGSTMFSSLPFDFDFPPAPRMAVDAQGRLFFSNGGFGHGRFYSCNPDLTERWSIPVPNINIGAPAIGQGGTLVIAGTGTNVRAYRTARACACDWNHSGDLNSQDFFDFLTTFFAGSADFNGNGTTDSQDFFDFLTCFFAGCP